MVKDLKFEVSIRKEWRQLLNIFSVTVDSRQPYLPQSDTKSHYIFI